MIRLLALVLTILNGTAFAQPALQSAHLAAPATSPVAPRAITHEDLWLMKRVGAPVVSPDGKWVVVSVSEPAYDDKATVADLWLVPAAGGVSRRLTATVGRESGANWSRDSQRIAFSAKRDTDEVEQIYILSLSGGEAQRVTQSATGARTPLFSPDGDAIAFVSSVYPGTLTDEDNKRVAAERKARKWNARIYDGFPVRSWDHWLDDKTVRLFVQPLDVYGGPAGAARNLLGGSALVKKSGFAGRTSDSGEDLDAVWTPDGKALVFAASTNRDTAAFAFTNTELFVVDAAGGEPRQLTHGNAWSTPRFSPDGRSLYALVEARNGRVYTASRLAVASWPVVDFRTLGVALDRSVISYAISPDGSKVYLTAEDAGLERVYLLDPRRDRVREAFPMSIGAYTNLSIADHAAGESVIIANWDSAGHPPEVVRLGAAPGYRALTSFNSGRVAALDLSPVEHFWFTSAKGRRIHNMLVRPPNFDPAKKYPLFVVIHGGPYNMWRDQWVLRWNYHLLAAPGYVVLLTNYTGSTGFGEAFAQAIERDPLRTPADEVNEAADEAIKRFAFIDSTRQCAGGASYGGHLSNWLQATTTRYRCLVSHAGLINIEAQWGTSDTIYGREVTMGGPPWEQAAVWREQNPIRYAAKFQTPALVSVGEQDFRVPLNNALEYWSALQRQRVPSRLIVFPEENHWVLKGEDSRLFYSEIRDWLARWLK